MVKIEFFYKGESLGCFPLKDHSNHEDREEVAEVNQIDKFDGYLLDDRVGAWVPDCNGYYIDGEDQVWLITHDPKVMKIS